MSEQEKPARQPGPVEAATQHELEQLRLSRSALAVSAVTLARHVDEADSAGAAASAARELRMTLAMAKSHLTPGHHDDDDDDQADEDTGTEGSVTPPSQLERMRTRATKGASRSRRKG